MVDSNSTPPPWGMTPHQRTELTEAIAKAIREERKACLQAVVAKGSPEMMLERFSDEFATTWIGAVNACAAAIRARGES
jgi:hypothetical protein